MKRVLMIVLPYLQTSDEATKNAPSTRMRSVATLPMGALSVITYNKDVAKFKLIDCNIDGAYLYIISQEMQNFNPDIVGLTMTFDNSYAYLGAILQTVRYLNPKITIVIGGAATVPIQTYKTILTEQKDINAVCFHDGEIPVRDLIQHGNFNNPAWITKCCVPTKWPVSNLDDVIDLDYSYLDINKYQMQEESLFADPNPRDKQFYVETSRGCPFQCTFCTYSRDNDRKVRYASIDKVIEYVKKLIDNHGMTVLSISDDQFLVNMPRAKEIFRRLEQFYIRVEILQGASVGFIDEELAHLMKRAGMIRVNLPIESGSQEVLDKMVEKPVNLDKAKEVIKFLKKQGLWVTANFVMGFPGETDKHRTETMKWIEESELDWCTFAAAIPVWGTKLYDLCVREGYISPHLKLGGLDFSNYFINVPGYPPEYVTRQIYNMNLKCNFVNNYQMRHWDYKTAAKAFRKVIGMYPNQAFAHYYLAKCIMKIDPKWGEYAKEFEIGG